MKPVLIDETVESFFVEFFIKYIKARLCYINNLEPKYSGKRTECMAYHYPKLFFVGYLAYVNILI